MTYWTFSRSIKKDEEFEETIKIYSQEGNGNLLIVLKVQRLQNYQCTPTITAIRFITHIYD